MSIYKHKWIICGFDNFINDINDKSWPNSANNKIVDFIESENFCATCTHDFEYEFNLRLYPNGDENLGENENFASLLLSTRTVEKNIVWVKWKCSVLGQEGQVTYSQDGKSEINNKTFFGISKFISHKLLKELLIDDNLTLFCEIQIIEDTHFDHTSQQVQMWQIGPLTLSKFAHKWTITNLSALFDGKSTRPQMIESQSKLTGGNGLEILLSFCLYPNGRNSDSKDYLSVVCRRMGLLTWYNMLAHHVVSNWRVSILNQNGLKLFTKGNDFKRMLYNLHCDRFITYEELFYEKNQFLQNDQLTLYFEIDTIQIQDAYQVSSMSISKNIEEYFEEFNHRLARKCDVTQSWTNANANVFKFEEIYAIPNFTHILVDHSCEHLETDNIVLSGCENICFKIFIKTKCGTENIQIFIYRTSALDSNEHYPIVKTKHRLFLVDCTRNKIQITDDTMTWENYSNLKIGEGIVCEVSPSEVQDLPNGFLLDDQFKLFVQMEVLKEEKVEIPSKIKSDQNNIHEALYSCTLTQIYRFAHQWSLNNFSSYIYDVDQNNVQFQSAPFSPLNNNRVKYFMSLLPFGEQENSDYVSLFLHLQDSDQYRIKTQFKLSILGPGQTDDFDVRHFKENHKWFALDGSYGFPLYVMHRNLLNPINHLLSNDQLTLLGEICAVYNSSSPINQHNSNLTVDNFYSQWKPQTSSNSVGFTKSQTELNKFNCSLQFEIDNFLGIQSGVSQQKSFSIKCPKYLLNENSNSLQFTIQVYPKGLTEESKNKVCIYLKMSEIETPNVIVKYKLSILDQDGKAKCISEFNEKIDNEIGFEWPEYIARANLTKHSDKLLPNGQLTILYEIQIFSESKCTLVELPNIFIITELNELFDNQQISDIIFTFEDESNKKLYGHKNVLSRASKIFKESFVDQPELNQFEIINFKIDEFEQMLRYIYTGEVDSNSKISDRLLSLSEYYHLYNLKNLCANELTLQIDSTTSQPHLTAIKAVHLLVLADDFKLDELKNKCIDRMINSDLVMLMKTKAWNVLHDRPQLMEEILCKLMIKFNELKNIGQREIYY